MEAGFFAAFFAGAFETGAFVPAVFFAGVFAAGFAAAFVTGAFVAVAFVAGLTAAFFAGVFVATGFFAAAFAAAGWDAAMLFVRNEHGSHNPDEAMHPQDLAEAVAVLAHWLDHKQDGN